MLNLISTPEAARILGKDRTTIWRWVRDGVLQPAAYANKQPLFEPNEIARLAAQLPTLRTLKAVAQVAAATSAA